MVNITVADRFVSVERGYSLLKALRECGIEVDAPCNGQGACGKCVVVANGMRVKACRTSVDTDMEVEIPDRAGGKILSGGIGYEIKPDKSDRLVLAFDIGTTTIVAYLIDGHTGEELSCASAQNPQQSFGADVMSRLQAAREGHAREMQRCVLDSLDILVRQALDDLVKRVGQSAGVELSDITLACVVGNTCMLHLALGIDTETLSCPPYMPKFAHSMDLPACEYLSGLSSSARLRVLPSIAGFVGADTVSCLVASDFGSLEKPTLLIDIGTNGEMVLGHGSRRVACSAAAGPAFEGALIDCGMRGTAKAIDHVSFTGELGDACLECSVIGDGNAKGICGSGVLDATAALLDAGALDSRGRLKVSPESPLATRLVFDEQGGRAIRLQDDVYFSQKDIRKVQMAKGAIRVAIELLLEHLGLVPGDIEQVLLAGGFGNYLDPKSACRIGMIPQELLERVVRIGNAAGQGAKICALSRSAFEQSTALAQGTEFLELASLPSFQDRYISCTYFQ